MNISNLGGILLPVAGQVAPKQFLMQQAEKKSMQHSTDDELNGLPVAIFVDKVNVPPTNRNLFWGKRSSKLDTVTSNVSTMKPFYTPTKPGLYWIKRSQKYPPLPFSTIVRNANKKKKFLNNDYYYY